MNILIHTSAMVSLLARSTSLCSGRPRTLGPASAAGAAAPAAVVVDEAVAAAAADGVWVWFLQTVKSQLLKDPQSYHKFLYTHKFTPLDVAAIKYPI